jgi:hypothetical protein
MPVTPEQRERLRRELPAEYWPAIETMLNGGGQREVRRKLGIGVHKLYKYIAAAETLIGQRIRAVHGRPVGVYRRPPSGRPPKVEPPKPEKPVFRVARRDTPIPQTKPRGDRCPRCWLLNPHICAEPMVRGEWMGDVESSFRERLNGGRR